MANNLLKNPIGVAAIVAVAVLAISLFANVGTGAYVSKVQLCKDTDGGINTAVSGTCSGTGGTFTDKCSSAATDIIEYSCLTTRECTFNAMQCNAGTVCVNGACV
ncbi:MAG: hypothetical protein J4472_00235 [DPANN group archaeon]|nr:hypothetical protein [DPANN group archaeon]